MADPVRVLFLGGAWHLTDMFFVPPLEALISLRTAASSRRHAHWVPGSNFSDPDRWAPYSLAEISPGWGASVPIYLSRIDRVAADRAAVELGRCFRDLPIWILDGRIWTAAGLLRAEHVFNLGLARHH